MEKSKQKKIIKQIERLCEKQYRKGFQQGFYTCKDKLMTLKQVDQFRYDGDMQGYSKVVHPHTGVKVLPNQRLSCEIRMRDMEELRLFLEC